MLGIFAVIILAVSMAIVMKNFNIGLRDKSEYVAKTLCVNWQASNAATGVTGYYNKKNRGYFLFVCTCVNVHMSFVL